MIKPTPKLIKFLSEFGNNSVLAESIGIDESTLSKLSNDKIPASANTIKKILEFTGWKFEETFDIHTRGD